MGKCLNCHKKLIGRSDKKYCDHHCKSSYQYQVKKASEGLYLKIDKQLKTNRKILKAYNKKGLTTIRKDVLFSEGFNPKFFTHYWKNPKGQVYLFCYEFGFLALEHQKADKYLLVQHQDYMKMVL